VFVRSDPEGTSVVVQLLDAMAAVLGPAVLPNLDS
jgi:hypothetical protein